MNFLKAHLLRIAYTIPIMLFLVALFVRLRLVLPTGFDGLYGQDPYAYYDFAGELRQAIEAGTALDSFFWPLGYPTLLATTFSIFGATTITAQAVSIIMGAALSPLVYLLARQMGITQWGGVVAALIITVSGQVIQSSIVIMADIPALFWVTLSALMLWHYIHTESRRWLVISVITLAIASITRWLNLALIVPWGLALMIAWKGHIRWKDSIIAILFTLPIFAPQLLFSTTNPYPTFNHAWVIGWSPANAFQQDFVNIDGQFHYEKINALFYALPVYDPVYLAAIFTPFLLIGTITLIRRKELAVWVMLLIWILLPYLFLAGIPYQNIRFPLILFPAVSVLVSVGIEAAWTAIRRLPHKAIATLVMTGVVAIGLWMMLDSGSNLVHTFIANQQRDKEVVFWAKELVPEKERLYTFGVTLTFQHYTDLEVYELYYDTPETLQERWQDGEDDYLLLNLWQIENQWAGREPQINYHWFRDTRGLEQIGRSSNYTLFRING